MKRQRNDVIQDYNKKRKLNKSILEDLANEYFYEIFEYLDISQVFSGFFDLNKRFKNLLMNSNLPIQINVPSMSKLNFLNYSKNLILPNKHRINYLRLSNLFSVDIIFSPPRIISKFLNLQTLIFDNIDTKYLHNILNQLTHLPKLHSFILNLAACPQNSEKLFSTIFSLPKLKYFKITCQAKKDFLPLDVWFHACKISPIEHLVINFPLHLDSFHNLLCCLPNLCRLTIDYLLGFNDTDSILSPLVLKHLKYVTLTLDTALFSGFEKLVKYYFHSIDNLRLTTSRNQSYLDAKQWEELIRSYLPNLRFFDLNHFDIISDTNLKTYHNLINEFNSLFWIQRGWFFTHQHDERGHINSGLFYSTNPYRRKDYTFYCELNQQVCPHTKEINCKSVKHVLIRNRQTLSDSINYFPNATELSLIYCFQLNDTPIQSILHSILPLEKLTKLYIAVVCFPFEQMVELISMTPNLHTLKLHLLSLNDTCSRLIKQTDLFRYVLKTNQIRHLEYNYPPVSHMELLVDLFPRLESIQIRMDKYSLYDVIRYLLTNRHDKLQNLSFLRVNRATKKYLRELDTLIHTEKLLDDYFIKLPHRDLYLWW